MNILLLSAGGGGGNILRSVKASFRRDLAVTRQFDSRYADRLSRAVTTRFMDTNEFALSDLPNDASAEVVGLDETCQGFSRRRLMDLGFTAGARVQPALTTFAGDPRAYRVRGTTIALRRDQAGFVLVKREPKVA